MFSFLYSLLATNVAYSTQLVWFDQKCVAEFQGNWSEVCCLRTHHCLGWSMFGFKCKIFWSPVFNSDHHGHYSSPLNVSTSKQLVMARLLSLGLHVSDAIYCVIQCFHDHWSQRRYGFYHSPSSDFFLFMCMHVILRECYFFRYCWHCV